MAYWDGKVMNSTDQKYGTKVNVTCAEGYRFVGGSENSYVIRCGLDGDWTPNTPDCQCK